MMRKLLTIIIPVRNEEETIGNTISFLQRTVHTPHVICIADDTTSPSDKTIAVVQKMQTVSLFINKKAEGDQDGFGPALVRASKKVTTPYTVIVMADSSDDPKTIDRMVQIMQKEPTDMVVGCRYMGEAKKIGGPILQGVLSTLFNAVLFWIFRFPTRDSTNAFKLYRTPFLKKILPLHPETGVEFSLQLTIRAVCKNGRMIDIPTIWRGREKGQSKVKLFSRGPKYLKLGASGLTVQLQNALS